MSEIFARAYVRTNRGDVTIDELLADDALLAASGLAGNPLGGVEIGTPYDRFRIDDAVGFVADEVLANGPALLRAGQPVRYVLRLSHGAETIEIEDGIAIADNGAGSHVEAPVEDLAAAFEAGYAQYRAALARARGG